MIPKTSKKREAAIKLGYRSWFEVDFSSHLKSLGIPVEYEKHKINYIKPVTKHKYIPDFRLPSGIFIETKGLFTGADRKKHLLVKACNPNIDIRFVFMRSLTKLSKTSKTTYAAWCNKNGFLYADKLIPIEWLNENNDTNTK
jgi:hypothetical protein